MRELIERALKAIDSATKGTVEKAAIGGDQVSSSSSSSSSVDPLGALTGALSYWRSGGAVAGFTASSQWGCAGSNQEDSISMKRSTDDRVVNFPHLSLLLILSTALPSILLDLAFLAEAATAGVSVSSCVYSRFFRGGEMYNYS